MNDKPKIFSLKNQKAFNYVNQDAKIFKSRFFIIVCKEVENDMTYKLLSLPEEVANRRGLNHNLRFLGLKASKKLGNAIKRNFIKRRIRALFYDLCMEHKDIEKSYAFIVIPRQLIAQTDFPIVKSNFQYLCKKGMS
jgi:ribonuclease P protein component